jgi:micrococcal nuclease
MAMTWTHPGALALAAIFVASTAFASPLPSCAGAIEAAGVQVVRVEKNGALILDDGRAVHVEGLLLPAGGADKAPEFLVGQALNELSELSHDRGVTLAASIPKEDRYGRVRAQVFLPDNNDDPWLQVAMLRRGLARVSLAPDRHECASELYAAEAQGRAAKNGLWSFPAYAMRTPNTLAHDTGTFQVVEGKVLKATLKGGRAYLDFGLDWHTDFTVEISPDDMKNFEAAGVDPRTYEGKTVRVRGFVQQLDGPEIEAAMPEAIEVLPDAPLKPAIVR